MLGWKEPGLGFLRQKLRCDPEVTHPPELQGFHLEARMTLPYSDHISPKCPFCLLRRESERLHNSGGCLYAPHAALHWLFHLLVRLVGVPRQHIHMRCSHPLPGWWSPIHFHPSSMDMGFFQSFGARNRQLSTAFPCSGSGSSKGHVPRSAVARSECTDLQTAPSGRLRGERPSFSVHFC